MATQAPQATTAAPQPQTWQPAAMPPPTAPPMIPVAQGSEGAHPNGPPVPGRLRPVNIAKTTILAIITLGIYFLFRGFKISGDLHRMPGGWDSWKLFFWLQLVPWVGIIFQLILYFKNNKQSNLLRAQRGLLPSWVPFILACIPIVNLAAPFVWAVHYNELARRT